MPNLFTSFFEEVAETQKQRDLDKQTQVYGPVDNEAVAKRMGRLSTSAPWLKPDATFSLARAGLEPTDPDFPKIAKAAGTQKVKERSGWKKFGDVITAPARASFAGVKGATRAIDTAGKFGGEVFNARSRDLVQRAEANGGSFTGNAKAGIATALDIIQTPTAIKKGQEDAASGVAARILNRDPSEMKSAGRVDTKSLIGETSFGVALDQLATTGKIDQGNGYFSNGKVFTEQAKRATEAAPLINGKAMTAGRYLASSVVEPGSMPYNVLSGLIDGTAQVALDPTNALGAFGKAAKAPMVFNDVKSTAGLVNGSRKAVIASRADYWLATKEGNDVLNFAANSDFATLYKTFKNQVPTEAVVKLADAKTPEEVSLALRPMLGLEINRAIQLPGKVDKVAANVSQAILKRDASTLRFKNLMPNERVNLDDLDDAVAQVDRFAINANLPEATRISRIEQMARADGRNARYAVLKDLTDDVAESLAPNIGRTKARQLTRMFHGDNDNMRKYFVDSTSGQNMKVVGATIDGNGVAIPSPHLYSEYIGQYAPMPPAREIREATTAAGRFLSGEGVKYTRNGVESTIPMSEIVGKGLGGGTKVVDFLANGVWKKMVLLRGAYAVRVVGEEQLRMAGSGLDSLINHPLSAIAYITGRKGNLTLTGDDFKDASLVADDIDEFGKVMSRGADYRAGGKTYRAQDQIFDLGNEDIRDDYISAWADQIMKLRGDEATRRVLGDESFDSTYELVTPSSVRKTKGPDVEIEGDLDVPGEAFANNVPPLYHGTAKKWDSDVPDDTGRFDAGARNLFGPGFYATDNENVARSYRKKGSPAAPTVYNITSDFDDVRVLDLEQPFPPEVQEALIARLDSLRADYSQETIDAIRGSKAADFYGSFKDDLVAEGFTTRTEADDYLWSINETIEEMGYDALRYSGGAYTKGAKESHNAYIFFSPRRLSAKTREYPKTNQPGPDIEEVVPEARSLVKDPVAATKQWFMDGDGKAIREDIASAPGREAFNFKDGADAHIDSLFDRASQIASNDPKILEAIRTGTIDGKPIKDNLSVTKALKEYLAKQAEAGIGPSKVVGQRTITGNSEGIDVLNQVVDRMFYELASRPTNVLSRSVSFKQNYWSKAEEILPYLDQEAQTAALKAAKDGKLDRSVIKRMTEVVNSRDVGDMTADEADKLSKVFALKKTQDLLFDVTRRNQFFDAYRLIFAFGDAWKEVLQTWSKLSVENPSVPRRFQQFVEGGRDADTDGNGQGFFFKDPTTGEETFTYPFSQQISQALLDQPIPFSAPVKGLNIFGSIAPGLGPAVQIPAGSLIPDVPKAQWLQDLAFPMGEPDRDAGGFVESFYPPWIKKAIQAGSEGELDERQYNNTVMNIWGQLLNDDKYDANDRADVQEAFQEARGKAKALYWIQSAAAFGAPASPQQEFLTKDQDGKLVMIDLLKNDLTKMYDEDRKNGTNTAVDRFLQKYGSDSLLLVTPKSEQVAGYVPVTKAGKDWARNNTELAKQFPSVYGLFAPSDGKFDIDEWGRQYRNGERVALSAPEVLDRSQQLIGNSIYRQAQKQVEGRTDKAATAWLAGIRNDIIAEYPGYGKQSFAANEIATTISEMDRASRNPTVAATDAGQGFALYMAAREKAKKAANGKSFERSKDTQYLRDWLNDIGTQIGTEHPDFKNMWDRVLSSEVSYSIDED